MSFDPTMIAAYVDGELDLVTSKRIENAMATDGGLAEAVARERALRGRLSTHFDPVLDEAVPDRLSALISGAANVDTSFADRLAARRLPSLVQWGAMAASLALGLLVGGYALDSGSGVTSGGDMVASGDLAQALNTQLASTQPRDAKVRIGTSFASAEGDYCRTFQSASLDGIACRSDGGWQLRQTMAGSKAADYRQASAGALAEAAAAMMADAPLDAVAERAARDEGWKK